MIIVQKQDWQQFCQQTTSNALFKGMMTMLKNKIINEMYWALFDVTLLRNLKPSKNICISFQHALEEF